MQVPSEGVRVLSGECLGFFLREVDNALAGKDVNSHIDVRIVSYKLVRVNAKDIGVAI